jgi:hypothetical protein
MKECDVFMNRLSKAMSSRQGIIARDEGPDGIRTEVAGFHQYGSLRTDYGGRTHS